MAAKRRRMTTIDEAKPAKRQHKSPCCDCPWSRESLPGWLGGLTTRQWLSEAHGEIRIECHTLKGMQCAGSAIYRGNVCKQPHDPSILLLPANREEVFSTPMEFEAHHGAGEE